MRDVGRGRRAAAEELGAMCSQFPAEKVWKETRGRGQGPGGKPQGGRRLEQHPLQGWGRVLPPRIAQCCAP